MKLILLPGNSPKNKPWIDKVTKSLSGKFQSTYTQYYDHWNQDIGYIDFDKETEKLLKNIKGDERYIVFAKSVGIMLTLKAISNKKINPLMCIFVGTPTTAEKLDEFFKDYTIPTLFIQQENDPLTSFDKLAEKVSNLDLDNAIVKEIEGNDHKYKNIEELSELVTKFVSG